MSLNGFKAGSRGGPSSPQTKCDGCGHKRKIVNKVIVEGKELKLCGNCHKMHPATRNAPKETP